MSFASARAHDEDKKDIDKMHKDELMSYAKSVLGVEVRQVGLDGKKNRWRRVDDVRRDYKEVQARLYQSLQEKDPLETPAEASSSSLGRNPSCDCARTKRGGRRRQLARD